MIERRLQAQLRSLIEEYPAVALLGSRQVGKTTLALEIVAGTESVYLDLESVANRAKLSDPELYLADHEDRLVILDEVYRVPDLFQSLRGLIDRGRRKGRRAGRFLLLGSASMDLLRQSGETLAGRSTYLERDVPQLGPRIPAETLRRFWVMLAHTQGGLLNAAALARGLGVDGKIIANKPPLTGQSQVRGSIVDRFLLQPPRAASEG